MKKIFKALNYIVALFFAITIISCDKEYSAIESDVLGENNFNFNSEQFEIPIKTYNKNLAAQQINGLSSNLLGYFNDPIYGETTASIVAQVAPIASTTQQPNIIIGENLQTESVMLTIPYFSEQIDADADGKPRYTLDSLFVENNNPANIKPIKLMVYENGYFLRNFDPQGDGNSSQNYFSKADASINNTDNFAAINNGIINFDELAVQTFFDGEYTFSSTPRSITTGTGTDEITEYFEPAIEINLAESDINKAYWKEAILDLADSPTLSITNNFLEHFRGLYIKAQAKDGDGSMVLLNLAGATITINYSSNDGDDEGDERDTGSYTLNFTGNRLNTFINNYNSILPSESDETNGDEKLYLKGTEGNMGIIELFSGMVDCDNDGQEDTDALECFKKTFRKTDANGDFIEQNGFFELKRLINEAHLLIYEDESVIAPDAPKDPNGDDYHAYDRLYIYNLENNSPIQDYNSDPFTETDNPLISRRLSLGLRLVDEQGNAKYKLKVTDLLNDILIRDVDVPKLGLVLTNNVNISSPLGLLNSTDEVTATPSTTVITPRGTVLHGNNASVTTTNGTSKRLRLEVFFTESK